MRAVLLYANSNRAMDFDTGLPCLPWLLWEWSSQRIYPSNGPFHVLPKNLLFVCYLCPVLFWVATGEWWRMQMGEVLQARPFAGTVWATACHVASLRTNASRGKTKPGFSASFTPVKPNQTFSLYLSLARLVCRCNVFANNIRIICTLLRSLVSGFWAKDPISEEPSL